jgi:hypothetical protein
MPSNCWGRWRITVNMPSFRKPTSGRRVSQESVLCFGLLNSLVACLTDSCLYRQLFFPEKMKSRWGAVAFCFKRGISALKLVG